MGEGEQQQVSKKRLVLSGIITGTVGRVLTHPIDTLKARAQVIRSRMSLTDVLKFGLVKTAKETYAMDGLKGFYRGVVINVLGGAPATVLYFYFYDQSKAYLSKLTNTKQSFMVGFFSGIVAEIISCCLWVPIDVIKERQQVMTVLKTYHYRNSLDAIRQISAQEGVISLYRAYGATILSFGPFTGLNMATYDKLKQWTGYYNTQIPFFHSFLMSSVSGFVASIITNPIDVVKVRMQVQRAERKGNAPLSEGRFGYRNSFHGLAKLVQEEGPFSLMKGVSARILFGILYGGIHLSINDYVKYTILKDFDKH